MLEIKGKANKFYASIEKQVLKVTISTAMGSNSSILVVAVVIVAVY